MSLGHNYIGTEHFLLALLEVDDDLGAEILRDRDVTLDAASDPVVKLLMPGGAGGKAPSDG